MFSATSSTFSLVVVAFIATASLCAMQAMAGRCDMATLSQCTETDTSDCCKYKADPYYKMQTGFYTGKILVNSLLESFKTSQSEVCDDKSLRSIESLAKLLIQYSSPSISSDDSYENTTLHLDFTSAFSYLLNDIQEEMCNWVDECFPDISCDFYLNLVSLRSNLMSNPDTSISIMPIWRHKWAEEALCNEGGSLEYKSATSYQCK